MSFTNKQLEEIYPILLKFAMKLTKEIIEAQDLTQSVAVRMLEKKELFNHIEGSTLLQWGNTIMFNMYINRYRRIKKFGSQFDPEPYILKLTQLPNQEAYTDLKIVLETIDKLPKHMKSVIEEISIKGNSYDEACKLLNVPIGTIRSRLSRARKILNNEYA